MSEPSVRRRRTEGESNGGEGGIRAESRRACEPRGSLKSTRAAIERAEG